MPQPSQIDIGDWVRVEIRRYKGSVKSGVSVIAGTVIEVEDRTWGNHTQAKLDNGCWFMPLSDNILEYRPHGPQGTD